MPRKVNIRVNGTPIEVDVALDGSETTVLVEDDEGRNIFGFIVNGQTVKIGHWCEDDTWVTDVKLGPPLPPDNWRAI